MLKTLAATDQAALSKLTKAQREALGRWLRQQAQEEINAGESTTNDLDAQHRFACRYAGTMLVQAAVEIERVR